MKKIISLFALILISFSSLAQGSGGGSTGAATNQWMIGGNTVSTRTAHIGTRDNRSLYIKNNTTGSTKGYVKIDSLDQVVIYSDTNSYNPALTIKGTYQNNAYMQLVCPNISAYRLKNYVTGKEWYLQNQTYGGGYFGLDGISLGRTSNPNEGYFGVTNRGKFTILNYKSGTYAQRFCIDTLGNASFSLAVGIGTATPASGYSFHVAGKATQTGLGESCVFGQNAGQNLSTSNYSSTAFGYNALKTSATDYVNVAIGASALENDNGGGSNTAVGYSALRFNTTGGNQCAYGDASLYNNTTGAENTGYGKATITGNVVGNGNTAMGFRAMQLSNAVATSGAFVVGKVYIIVSAGTTNFTLIGAANSNVGTQFTATGVGTGNGTAAPVSNYNTAIGYQSMYLQNNGNLNTGLGYQALYSNSNGVNNTAIGSSGLANVTTGTANIGLGYASGKYVTTLTNRLFINSIDRSSAANDSLLSIIYGYQASSTSNQRLVFNSSLNILGAVTGSSSIVSISKTAGVGYAAGSGSTVTQATNRTTGVTINAINGAITLVSAAGSTSWQTFVVTNSAVVATDVPVVVQKSGTDLNEIHVTNVAAGTFNISFKTTGGTTTEQPVFNFAIIKAVTN